MRTIRLALIAAAVIAALSTPAAEHFSYIYSRNSNMTIVNGSANFDQVGRMKSRWGTPFLWFASKGKAYVIRDAATLAEVSRLFASVDVTTPKYEELRRRMQPLEDEEQALDRKVDALDDKMDALDEREDAAALAEIRNLEVKMRDLERSMRAIEAKMRVLEQEEEELDRHHDALEREAERKLIPLVEKAIATGVAQRV
jgi:Rad3-related DNA helicase